MRPKPKVYPKSGARRWTLRVSVKPVTSRYLVKGDICSNRQTGQDEKPEGSALNAKTPEPA